MLEKERFYKKILLKKNNCLIKIILIYLLGANVTYADIQEDIINNLLSTKTLSFNFKQKISKKEEVGNCFIKYPLLMKCSYANLSGKVIIANGKSLAIIKKKYKKIYYYPLKFTPLFFILDKDKILNLIKNSVPTIIDKNLIVFEFADEKLNKLKIFFDTENLEFRGWETKDNYSNNVSFKISNLKKNKQIVDSFFKVPREDDL